MDYNWDEESSWDGNNQSGNYGSAGNYKNYNNTSNYNIPKTIDELRIWYSNKKYPPYVKTGYYINTDVMGRCRLGIKRAGENVVVYSNSNQTRTVKYRGTDEAYAVRMMYDEMIRYESDIIRGVTPEDFTYVDERARDAWDYASQPHPENAKFAITLMVGFIYAMTEGPKLLATNCPLYLSLLLIPTAAYICWKKFVLPDSNYSNGPVKTYVKAAYILYMIAVAFIWLFKANGVM